MPALLIKDIPAATPVEVARFQRLTTQWHQATDTSSSLTAKFGHAAYQQIIGMGPAALPLILAELRDRPAWWFWALAAIARDDPAAEADTFSAARTAWLDWAAANGTLLRLKG
jgi:hypothetical protein